MSLTLILTFGCDERDLDLELEFVVDGPVEDDPVDQEPSARMLGRSRIVAPVPSRSWRLPDRRGVHVRRPTAREVA